ENTIMSVPNWLVKDTSIINRRGNPRDVRSFSSAFATEQFGMTRIFSGPDHEPWLPAVIHSTKIEFPSEEAAKAFAVKMKLPYENLDTFPQVGKYFLNIRQPMDSEIGKKILSALGVINPSDLRLELQKLLDPENYII